MRPGAAPQHSNSDVSAGEGTLGARIAETPFLPQPDQSFARLEDWLAETPQRDELRETFAESPKARALIASFFDYSPHLSDLARADPERLLRLLRENPESHIEGLLANAADALSGMSDEADAMRL